MKLAVPVISQLNPVWKNLYLGTSSNTIGADGCAITSCTMMLQYERHSIDVPTFNNWLILNEGYAAQDELVWSAIGRLAPDIQVQPTVNCGTTPAPLDQIKASIDAGNPVVLGVSFNKDPNLTSPDHFVIAVGHMDDGTFIINDPWYGDQVFFTARYGDQASFILQVNCFVGHVVDVIQPVPQPVPVISQSSAQPVIDNPSTTQPTTPPVLPVPPVVTATTTAPTTILSGTVSSATTQPVFTPIQAPVTPKTAPIQPGDVSYPPSIKQGFWTELWQIILKYFHG